MLFAKLMQVKAIAWTKKLMVSGTLVSNFETKIPEMGKPIKEAIGIANRRVPSSASLKPNAALMVGIREAQVENETPARKKNMLKKVLCLLLESMY